MDSIMGTGTTGVVAKKLGREFIGFELLEKYFLIAKERIEYTKKTFFFNLDFFFRLLL